MTSKKKLSKKNSFIKAKRKNSDLVPLNLRESILEEAMKIVAESGVSHLSLREIARRLNVSHSAPNRHFATKEDLLAGIGTKGFRLFAEYLKEGVKEADNRLTALDGFNRMKENYLKFARNHPDLFKFIFSSSVPNNPKYSELQFWSMESFEILVRQLTRLREFGVLKQGNVFECAMFCNMTMQGYALHEINGMNDYLCKKNHFTGNLKLHLENYILAGMNEILTEK